MNGRLGKNRKKGADTVAELTAPVVKQNDEKRIVYGAVLIPDEPDSDNDVVSAEKIEEVAHNFMVDYGNIDLQHSLNNVADVVESYILPFDWEVSKDVSIPEGSWVMGVKVQDDKTWELVKDGTLTGFSIMGVSKAVIKSKKNSHALKRTTLADLGDDWIVNAVSLVDEPAVPKAKFIAIKSKAKKEGEAMTTKAFEGSLESIGDLIRRTVHNLFDTESTDSYVEATFPDNVVIRVDDLDEMSTSFYRIGYKISESGEVVFTTEPEEVVIREVIEPADGSDTEDDEEDLDSEDEETEETEETEEVEEDDEDKEDKEDDEDKEEKEKEQFTGADKSLLDKVMEKLGVKQDTKKGKEDESLKKEEVQSMIDESIKSIDDKVEEILSTLKGEDIEEVAKGLEDHKEQKDAKKNTKETEDEKKDNQEEETVSKAEYDKLLDQLETLKGRTSFSRRLTGQDSMTAEKKKENKPKRDAFGFKIG